MAPRLEIEHPVIHVDIVAGVFPDVCRDIPRRQVLGKPRGDLPDDPLPIGRIDNQTHGKHDGGRVPRSATAGANLRASGRTIGGEETTRGSWSRLARHAAPSCLIIGGVKKIRGSQVWLMDERERRR